MKSLVFITANSFTTWNASIFYINNVFKSKKREKKKGRKKKEIGAGEGGGVDFTIGYDVIKPFHSNYQKVINNRQQNKRCVILDLL